MVVRFKDFNFLLSAIVGLGLALPQNVRTEYARLDGAFPDYTRKPTRQFTLTGLFSGRSYQELRSSRSDMAQLFDRDLIGLDQQMVLLHQIEQCDTIQTDTARVVCKYVGGLDGNVNNHNAEQAAISFEQYMPFVVWDGEQGDLLDVQDSFTANRFALRSPAGVWSSIGTGGNAGEVVAITRGNNGIYYIGGSFTSFNGVANTNAVVQYDPATGAATAMGSGAGSGVVDDFQVAPNGDIWAVGTFQNMGGIAAADYVARWDGSVWNAVGTPAAVTGLANGLQSTFDGSGNFYYPTGSGLTVRKWDGAAWSTLGTATGGGSAQVTTVIRGPDGNLYVGGNFTTIGGVSANSVARYNFTTAAFESLGSSFALTETVHALAFDLSGKLYAGTTPSGTTPFWVYNGAAWQRISNLTGTVFTLNTTPSGLIAFGGTIAGEPSLIDRAGFWNGAAVSPLDIDLPGAPNVYRVWVSPDGTMAVGYDTAGTATAPGSVTITNNGTAKSYPTIRLAGPSSGTARFYEILNVTTGRSIYLNYTMNVGETATLQFQPDNLSFVSSFTGNIANTILPGSNEADFFLQPGANTLTIFSTGTTTTATIQWRPQYVSLDDIT